VNVPAAAIHHPYLEELVGLNWLENPRRAVLTFRDANGAQVTVILLDTAMRTLLEKASPETPPDAT